MNTASNDHTVLGEEINILQKNKEMKSQNAAEIRPLFHLINQDFQINAAKVQVQFQNPLEIANLDF